MNDILVQARKILSDHHNIKEGYSRRTFLLSVSGISQLSKILKKKLIKNKL